MNKPEPSEGHKILLFLSYTSGVYLCTILAAIFQEKLYKVPYPRNVDPKQADIFNDNLTPMGIIAGVACIIGYVSMNNEQFTFNIPVKKLVKMATCDILIHVCLVSALLLTNYTTLIVVNTFSLVSVVLVGAFCSGVNYDTEEDEFSDQPISKNESVGADKLWMCGVICLGIITFSIFSSSTQSNPSSTQSNSAYHGSLLLIIFLYGTAIVLQGFRPDIAAQIKHEHRPSTLFFYFSINGTVFFMILLLSIVTWRIAYFFTFAMEHSRMLIDLTAYSVLYALGGFFAYKLINTFRQHIYPLVANTRRCLTVCINVAWYGHKLAKMQWVGIMLVFGGILIEVIKNYNLADKLRQTLRTKRKGFNYNKIQSPYEEQHQGYQGVIAQGVEGI